MSNWLDRSALFRTVQSVTTRDPKGIECMERRSEDPFDYMEFISKTLNSIGKIAIRKFGEADRSLRRKKDNEESRKLREEGNRIFLDETGMPRFEEEALELYTKSIAYAIPNTSEMAKGFANRSALLLRIGRLKECLADTERALNSNYPQELMPKLYIRRGECFSILAHQSYMQSKFWLNKVPVNDPYLKKLEKDLKKYQLMDVEEYEATFNQKNPVLPVIELPSEKFPCASDAIDVKYSGLFGRKIVATRDIRVGEVLVVEKPYSAHNLEGKYYCYCSHCIQQCIDGIPCESCPNTIYCSEKCKELAWKEYHNFECPVLCFLLHNEILRPRNEGMTPFTASLKLLIQFSQEAGGLDALEERIKQFQKHKSKNVKGEWYQKQTLESVLTLDSNIKKIFHQNFQIHSVVAILTLFHLATTTKFFGVQYRRDCMSDKDIVLAMSHNKKIQFVGGLLIKLLLIVQYNTTPALDRISKELNFGNKKTKSLIHNNYRGLFVMSFIKLINCTCYFNTMLQYIGEHVILHSVFPIKKGEEVLMFREFWMFHPKELRDAKFEQWEAACSCKACVENWPTFDRLESCEKTTKSPAARIVLQEYLRPLPMLHDLICEKQEDRVNPKETLNALAAIMETIFEAAHLPCREQFLAYRAIAHFYHNTGMTNPMMQSKSFEFTQGPIELNTKKRFFP